MSAVAQLFSLGDYDRFTTSLSDATKRHTFDSIRFVAPIVGSDIHLYSVSELFGRFWRAVFYFYWRGLHFLFVFCHAESLLA